MKLKAVLKKVGDVYAISLYNTIGIEVARMEFDSKLVALVTLDNLSDSLNYTTENTVGDDYE